MALFTRKYTTENRDTPYLERDADIYMSGNEIPHWHQNGKYVFITFRLGDSLPQSKLNEYKAMREEWLKKHPKPWNAQTQREYIHTFTRVIDKWIDLDYGSCILRDMRCAKIVEDAFNFYNLKRYQLEKYVIMPNHVHVLMQLYDTNLEIIVNDWKSYTAHAINKLLCRKGGVWANKFYDRLIRNRDHYLNAVDYIDKNFRHGGIIKG